MDDILNKLYALVDIICTELRREGKYAKVVSVTLRDKYFNTRSHQRKLNNATNSTNEIYSLASTLAKELWDEEPIRLIGISLNGLTTVVNYQISFFENSDKKIKNEELDKVVDDLKIKYGSKKFNKASLINIYKK